MKLNRLNKTASLPNGLRVHYVSPPDVQFLYGEIFDDEAYLKHGVTIEPDDVVIDVGANIGMFAMYAARKCHRGRVFSFEPIPPTYQTLRRNVRENLGCAEGVGVSTFVSSGDQTTSCAADFERRSSADDAVAFEAYPCANNSLDDADFADVAGRQLRSVEARHPSKSAPDGGSVFNLGDWDAVAAAREKDDDDAPVVTAVGGEIFERVVSPGEEDNEQRGAEYRSSSSKRRAHPGGGEAAGGPAADAPAPASSSDSSSTRKKSNDGTRDSSSSSPSSPPSGAVWAYNCGVSDGSASSASFTFYPHAAGWSTMAPDDVETSDNVRQFVESTLSGDEKASTGALHPLATLGRWLLRKGNTTRETESGGKKGAPPGLFARLVRWVRGAMRSLFSATLDVVLRFLLGGQETYSCPLVTVSDVIDSHDLERVGLLKVDVERAELAVLRGIRPEHWRRIRQVVMEVHDLPPPERRGGEEGGGGVNANANANGGEAASAPGGARVGGALEEAKRLLLEVGDFPPARMVAEQPRGLEGSSLWNLYARR